MDIRELCDAPASRLAPNAERLVAAFRGGRLDRCPNFEILMDPKIVGLIMDWPAEKACNSFALGPHDYIELSRRTAQDAIVVNLNVWAGGMGAITSIEQLGAVALPDANAFRQKAKLAFAAVSGTNLGVVAHAGGPLFSSYCVSGPVAIQSFMLNLYDNPEFVERLMDWHTLRQLETLEAVMDLPFAAIYLADDLCDNTGFLFPPAVIQTLWEPRIARLATQIRSMGGAPLWFHCCGNLTPLLPILDRLGVNAIHPLQPACNDIVAVRRQWGNRFCLVGNLNVEGVLAFGTPDDVRRDAREKLAQLGAKGAYVLASSHSIVDAIPAENYFAMVETAVKYG